MAVLSYMWASWARRLGVGEGQRTPMGAGPGPGTARALDSFPTPTQSPHCGGIVRSVRWQLGRPS